MPSNVHSGCAGRSGETVTFATCCVTWYTCVAGNGSCPFVPIGDWCARVRPSYAIPVAGLIALFGAMVGAGPVSADRAMGCFTGGIGMFIDHGVVKGLAQLPHPVVPLRQLPSPHDAYARELSPFFAISIPDPVRSPIRMRSRRVKPALMSSWRFLNAWYISFQRERDTFSPLALKYMLPPSAVSRGGMVTTNRVQTSNGDFRIISMLMSIV